MTLYIENAVFWDTDNETIYGTRKDLQRPVKVICNVIYH